MTEDESDFHERHQTNSDVLTEHFQIFTGEIPGFIEMLQQSTGSAHDDVRTIDAFLFTFQVLVTSKHEGVERSKIVSTFPPMINPAEKS